MIFRGDHARFDTDIKTLSHQEEISKTVSRRSSLTFSGWKENLALRKICEFLLFIEIIPTNFWGLPLSRVDLFFSSQRQRERTRSHRL